jgi:quinol monooxygenase YgiN
VAAVQGVVSFRAALPSNRTGDRCKGPDTFFFYENWESGDDLDAHLAAPHLVEFAGRIAELLDESGLSVNRVRRIA